MKLLQIAALAFLPFLMTDSSFARSTRASRPYYGGGKHTSSHGGRYSGGRGSSHKGGHYRNRAGQHVYGTHK